MPVTTKTIVIQCFGYYWHVVSVFYFPNGSNFALLTWSLYSFNIPSLKELIFLTASSTKPAALTTKAFSCAPGTIGLEEIDELAC